MAPITTNTAAATADQSTAPRAALPASSAAQQGDNIAHALAGAGGGLAAMALTYPLVTLSTRAQVESKKTPNQSFVDAVRHIIAREGVTGLYSGLDSALFGISVTNFVYYYWYEWTKAWFERAAIKAGRASTKLTTAESMIAGAIAGSATVLSTNPIWVVNTRMTARQNSASDGEKREGGLGQTSSQPAKKQSTLKTLQAILREEGVGALWAGVLPALVLVVNPIIQYTVFEQLKNRIESRRAGNLPPRDSFLLGMLSKLIATGVTYPYLTVKSRAHVAKKQGEGAGLIGSLTKIYDEEGLAGLYGGIGPKISQSVITAGFLFAFKDFFYEKSVALRRTAASKAL